MYYTTPYWWYRQNVYSTQRGTLVIMYFVHNFSLECVEFRHPVSPANKLKLRPASTASMHQVLNYFVVPSPPHEGKSDEANFSRDVFLETIWHGSAVLISLLLVAGVVRHRTCRLMEATAEVAEGSSHPSLFPL